MKGPVRIYEVIIEDHEWMHPMNSNSLPEAPKLAPEKSIAVLPFVNMSNDAEQVLQKRFLILLPT